MTASHAHRLPVRLRVLVAATAAAVAVAVVPGGGGGPDAHAQQAAPACPDGGVPWPDFPDTVGNIHEPAVACVAWYGLANGVRSGAFAPTASVRRDQMASFVARLLETAGAALPAARDQGFGDIAGNAHAERINQLAELGVVQGLTPTSYGPARAVRRDQMATFLVRAYEVIHGEPLAAPPSGFADIGGNRHETNIDKAAAAGFAQGTSATAYRPGDPVRRDQMASFLARTLGRAVTDGHLAARQPVSPRLTNSSRLHARGVGPVVAGMTLAEAEQLTGTAITPEEFKTFDGYCFYGQPEGVTAYTFLLVAPGEQPLTTPREGVIALVVTGWTPPNTGTLAGVAPGDTPAAVEAAYGSDWLQRNPHEYQEGGVYLDLYASGGQFGMRFSVGSDGVVEYIHTGDAAHVPLVEGCA